MNIKSVVVAGLITLALGACGSKKAVENGSNAAQDVVKTPLPDKLSIYFGTTGPTLFNVPEEYQLAIGALLDNGDNFCTGTLIAEDVVLSAGHCAINTWTGRTSSTRGMTFGLGTDMKNPTAKIAVKQIIPHPNYFSNARKNDDSFARNDVALFILQESALKHVPNLKPIPMNKSSLADLKGQMVQNVGFGGTETNDNNTKRFWTTEEVKTVTSYDFTVNGKGQSSVCFGDSGGPSLFVIDNQIFIIGTVSWGDESCVDNDHYARTNDNIAWITETLESIGHAPIVDQLIPQIIDSNTDVGPVEDPCKGISFAGVCDGDVAKWCDNGVIFERDCSLEGKNCGFSASANGNYCLDKVDVDVDNDPCHGITYLGTCEGNVSKWCANGSIVEIDCSLSGGTCSYIGPELGYYCI